MNGQVRNINQSNKSENLSEHVVVKKKESSYYWIDKYEMHERKFCRKLEVKTKHLRYDISVISNLTIC